MVARWQERDDEFQLGSVVVVAKPGFIYGASRMDREVPYVVIGFHSRSTIDGRRRLEVARLGGADSSWVLPSASFAPVKIRPGALEMM